MKVSVIIPVYNVEKYIRECLDSFVNQTEKDIEIICVDDGSTDNSLDILNEYKEKYSNISVYTQTNQGAGTARNLGIEKAKGEYLYFFDADDYAELNLCEDVYKIAQENDYPDLIKFRFKCFDNSTKPFVYGKESFFENFDKKLFKKLFNFYDYPDETLNLSVVPWSGFYKKSFILENNIKFNSLKCVNDLSFFINVIILAKNIYVDDNFYLMHRLNNSSSLVGVRDKYFYCEIESYKILDEMTKGMDISLRNRILNYMLTDILYWYMHFIRKSTYHNEIYKMTKGFLNTIDIRSICKGRKYYFFKIMKTQSLFICQILALIFKLRSCLLKLGI